MSDIKITQDYENAIEQAQIGELVAIAHRLYSHVKLIQIDDEFSFECQVQRAGRSPRVVSPTVSKNRWMDTRTWKTLKGAKRNALKFLA